MLEVRLLGKFEVRHDGKPIIITSRPAQSLFAHLILNAGTAQRREKLARLLWPDSLEETARENLRHALWRLRKGLESASSTRFLHADDVAISFKESPDYRLDTAELVKLSKDASADELIAVLSNYQGELLPGFNYEWVNSEREHLNSVFEHQMARLMSLLQEEKRWADILDWGERWIEQGQKPEPAYRALMRAHAAKGDMSKVATTYQRCVNSLKQFGMEPSEQTRELYQSLKSGNPDLETASNPAVKNRSDSLKTNLPIPLTSFVGREPEIQEVRHLLSSTRLLTLTGTGGIGKTRLAIQAAREMRRSFKDGVWWVGLASLNDAALVPQAVAQVLGVRESPGQPLIKSISEFLRQKQLLLILDNCEHVIASCGQLVDSLLAQCATLSLLVTSREALGITGETTLRVRGLSFPTLEQFSEVENPKEFESIRLFADRVAVVQRKLALTKENAFAMTQICQRLDGIPLALELAAARVRVLSLEEIAKRLDDRFALLTRGSRTALPRHQTLRALIDWSYDLLPAQEQILFRRLAVFAGGCTLEEAQVVCSGNEIGPDEILDLLSHLMDKSLVSMPEQDGTARYQMLETIREYALHKFLDSKDVEQVRNRHLEYFMNLAEEIEPRLHGAEQAFSLKRLEIEHDNLRAALEWSLTGGDFEMGMRLAGVLWLFWDIYGYQLEGRIWLDRILSKRETSVRTPSISAQAKVLYVAGHLRQRQGDLELARREYTASLALYRQLENKLETAVVLRGLGEIAQDEGDLIGAKDYYEQSLSISRNLNDLNELSTILGHLAILALLLEDYEQAASLGIETLAIGQKRGDKRLTTIALTTLGFASCGKGNLEEATLHFAEALTLQSTLTDKRVAQYSLIGLGLVAFVGSHPQRAVRLFGAADAQREMIGIPLPPSQRPLYDSLLTSIRAELDPMTFQAMWAEGRAMTLEQAIEFALKETEA